MRCPCDWRLMLKRNLRVFQRTPTRFSGTATPAHTVQQARQRRATAPCRTRRPSFQAPLRRPATSRRSRRSTRTRGWRSTQWSVESTSANTSSTRWPMCCTWPLCTTKVLVVTRALRRPLLLPLPLPARVTGAAAAAVCHGCLVTTLLLVRYDLLNRRRGQAAVRGQVGSGCVADPGDNGRGAEVVGAVA